MSGPLNIWGAQVRLAKMGGGEGGLESFRNWEYYR